MKYVVVVQDSALFNNLYRDLLKIDNVSSYYVDKYKTNDLKNKFKRIHTSLLINSYIDMPCKYVYYSELFNYVDDDTCYIFSHASATKVGKRILHRLKQSGRNVHLVLLLIDSFNAHTVTLFRAWRAIKKIQWDLILSYDIEDCKKYGFTYLGYTYCSRKNGIIPSGNESYIYFVGENKPGDNLYDLVSGVFKYLNTAKIKARFIVVDSFKKHVSCNTEQLIFKEKYIPYDDVLSDVLSSNCILEILQAGQQQQSARYFEAICYNKKLLTNNPHIVELPFYDSRYMKYFSKPDDIDVEWVKRKENIDYNYRGEFSSAKIIEQIEKIGIDSGW